MRKILITSGAGVIGCNVAKRLIEEGDQPSCKREGYDVVFSTSVIEHLLDDEQFARHIGGLLAPGGVAVLTCDFNVQYWPEDPIPNEDFRLYTCRDLVERLLPMLPGCTLVDEPDWECSEPDFLYAGCCYTFASLVFRKNI
jgi:hypothetical protein